MKKALITAVLAVPLGLVVGGIALAHVGETGRAYGHGVHAGSMGWMGHHTMGRMGRGPGRHDMGYRPSCCRVSGEYGASQEPLTRKQASSIAREYVAFTGNRNLKVGRIQERGGRFEAEIVTKKEGALVERVLIDKKNGWVCGHH